MLETILIEKPSEKQIKKYGRRYVDNDALSPKWRSGLTWNQKLIDFVLPTESKHHEFYRRMAEQSMSTEGKLLLAGARRKNFLRTFYPLGFVSYMIGDQSFLCSEWNSVQKSEEVRDKRVKNKDLYNMAFAREFLGILLGGSKNDAIVSSDELKKIYPYTEYEGKGPIMYIQTIEVDTSNRKEKIGTNLLKKIIEVENPEIIEGLADPASLVFWEKMGFSILPLYQKQLTAIAWKNPAHK